MIIDDEFKNLLPPLSDEDYRGLEESLKKEGCRDPLVVWGEVLIDGHNRYEICTTHSIPYQTVQRDFPDREAVILWIITNQMSRRNLTPFQRAELALRLKPVVAEKAKENQREAGGAVKDKLPKAEKTSTREELGKIAGVSGKTIDRAEIILTKGTKENIQEVRDGKASIYGKAKEIKERGKPIDPPKQEDPATKKPEYTEFQQQFLNNSPHILRVLKSIDDECRDVMSPRERKAFDRIVTGIKELQEIIGG